MLHRGRENIFNYTIRNRFWSEDYYPISGTCLQATTTFSTILLPVLAIMASISGYLQLLPFLAVLPFLVSGKYVYSVIIINERRVLYMSIGTVTFFIRNSGLDLPGWIYLPELCSDTTTSRTANTIVLYQSWTVDVARAFH